MRKYKHNVAIISSTHLKVLKRILKKKSIFIAKLIEIHSFHNFWMHLTEVEVYCWVDLVQIEIMSG